MAGNPKIKGTQLWKLRKSHGREKIYKTPDALWKAACKYFQWCVDNPIKSTTGTTKDGKTLSQAKVNEHIRAMTIQGLSIHLGITPQAWRVYRNREEFTDTCDLIEAVMYEQKFTGAAAGELNPAIISRDLGLTDKHELGTAPDGTEPMRFNIRFIDCE